jgi:hypothetical protein
MCLSEIAKAPRTGTRMPKAIVCHAGGRRRGAGERFVDLAAADEQEGERDAGEADQAADPEGPLEAAGKGRWRVVATLNECAVVGGPRVGRDTAATSPPRTRAIRYLAGDAAGIVSSNSQPNRPA